MKKGFTLIELVVAIGLSALFIPAIVYVFSLSLSSATQGENYTKAYSLAQKTMEAVYFLKENDTNWDWKDDDLYTDDGKYYQPVNSGGSWELGAQTSNPLPDGDGYTVTAEIIRVQRDEGGNIVLSGGTLDDYTRKVIVNVSWEEKGQLTEIDLVSYISKH